MHDLMNASQLLGAEAQERQLPTNISRLRDVRSHLSDVRDRVIAASGRLNGIKPKGVSTEKNPTTKASGYISELSELVGECESLLQEISAEMNELERAV